MGFFDMGGSSSTPVASTATTEPVSTDTAISFDSSDVLMIDDSNVISFDANEGIASLPNTAGELFQAPEVEPSAISFDAPVVSEATLDSGFSLFSSNESVAAETPTFNSPVSDFDFVTETLAGEARDDASHAEPMASMEVEMSPTAEVAVIAPDVTPVAQDEIVDAESTLIKAIAELEANASKIQSKVDAAFEQEAALLEEKANKEEAHKLAMEALQAAAESARKTALEIQKSGERTLELKKLFEAQLV
ncbi:MAG: hypothetical protein PHU93_02020 [Candidatus Gracilibacteria bacterium]|nr:hypothetical protein [Candidatus Gracilibacteria bacterium]